jgi:predicted Zn-dependent protease
MLWLAVALLQGALFQDPGISGYVEKVCAKLSPHVTVLVNVAPEPRAGVTPDGTIRITTGLIADAENEAELVGILAHDIAHARRGEVCNRFIVLEPDRAQSARKTESAADRAALEILAKAHYDPAAMLRYFSRIRHAEPVLPTTFSAEDILLERLELEATDHPLKDPVVDTDEFRAIRARLK